MQRKLLGKEAWKKLRRMAITEEIFLHMLINEGLAGEG
jgi:hypothetical protein